MDGLKPLRNFVRHHERRIATGYVVLLLSGWVALMVPSTRQWLGTGLERVADHWNYRWLREVTLAESLLDAGRVEEAATLLEALDQRFPAQHRVHGLAPLRIRLLRDLGRAHMELGRKRRTLETLRTLVDFDPRNYSNHFQLGVAAEAFVELEDALAAYTAAFEINPSHVPTLEALVRLAYDAGEFGSVVDTYHRFLTARDPIRVSIRAGADSSSFILDYDAVLPIEVVFENTVAVWDSITARFQDASIVVDSVVVHPALMVGTSESPAAIRLSSARAGAATTNTGRAFIAPTGGFGYVAWDLAGPGGAVSGLSIWIEVPRVVPAALWAMVQRSHQNALAWAALAEADRRTVVQPEEAP